MLAPLLTVTLRPSANHSPPSLRDPAAQWGRGQRWIGRIKGTNICKMLPKGTCFSKWELLDLQFYFERSLSSGCKLILTMWALIVSYVTSPSMRLRASW